MDTPELLADAFGRIRSSVQAVVEDLDADALAWRPEPQANTIGWLTWHLARVQDDHVADVAGQGQVWGEDTWAERFGLPSDATGVGFGDSADDVARIRPAGPEPVVAYLDAVTDRTLTFLGRLIGGDLDEVIDTSWDPPVTLGVRMVSVLGDDLKHAGQAEYLKGMYQRLP